MPVITSRNGAVVAWSGIQAGPIREYEPVGKESPWVRYEAEVGTGGSQTAKVVVRVQKSWRTLVPQLALSIELSGKTIVNRFIEERVTGNYQPLALGVANHFSISDQQMLESYQEQQRDGNGEREI
jgi:hypothetical protein